MRGLFHIDIKKEVGAGISTPILKSTSRKREEEGRGGVSGCHLWLEGSDSNRVAWFARKGGLTPVDGAEEDERKEAVTQLGYVGLFRKRWVFRLWSRQRSREFAWLWWFWCWPTPAGP